MFRISDVEPGQHGILRHVRIPSPCDLIEPLQVLVVGKQFVYPLRRFATGYVITVAIFFNSHTPLHGRDEAFDVPLKWVLLPAVEIQQHFAAVFELELERAARGVEALPADFAKVGQGH